MGRQFYQRLHHLREHAEQVVEQSSPTRMVDPEVVCVLLGQVDDVVGEIKKLEKASGF